MVESIVKFLLKSICWFIYPMDKRLITFIVTAEHSGCNVSPILEQAEKLSFYKIKTFKSEISLPNTVWKKLSYAWNYYKLLAKSRLIVTTHGLKKLRARTIHLELWHGFATKKAGLLDRREKSFECKPDVVCCYSNFDAVLKNARWGLTIDEYVVCGAPRNDYLFIENGHENLEKLFKMRLTGERKILFAPTFRVGYRNFVEGKRTFDNIFDFEDFDVERFCTFLRDNRIFLFVKLHPFEERFFREKVKAFETDRIKLIDTQLLQKEKMDLYKLLNAFDLLISDYSSLYFDWLLLNRPVIFTPTDIEEYWNGRGGWLLEPYDFWAAGPKCTDQESLEREILKSLEDLNYYRERRETIRDIVHRYRDARSTERVIQLIKKLMEEGKP
ncbi:CDP-glycerol glycerophosphotransferase family protein [Pseudothermotoga sp.]